MRFSCYFAFVLKNDLLLRAAAGKLTERTPVWIMRQAGRVLPEYRKVREKAGSFLKLVKTPELAAEVSVQPVDILGVDAAIIFSDILVIPEAMGLPYEMIESRGPYFPMTCRDKASVDALHIADPSSLRYVTDAISILKKELDGRVPLIGFAGAPWTVFAYMVEGKGSKTFSEAKRFLYTEPVLSHQLLDKITQSTITYLLAQVKAGADLLQIFDSWAGILSPEQYREFSLRYISTICDEIKSKTNTPLIVFPKDAHFARQEVGALKCDVISLDWTMDIAESRQLIGPGKVLQGNADPCLLYAKDEVIIESTEKMLKAFGPTGHIANLGHGLYPDIPKEKVRLFVDTIKSYRHVAS